MPRNSVERSLGYQRSEALGRKFQTKTLMYSSGCGGHAHAADIHVASFIAAVTAKPSRK
jgi:hypothetical protein